MKTTTNDPIVDEVRKTRHNHAAQFGHVGKVMET